MEVQKDDLQPFSKEHLNKRCVHVKQVVAEIDTWEKRSYRKADSGIEPDLTRSSLFSLKGEDAKRKYQLHFDGIHRDAYWPEFIEADDEITFYAQKGLFPLLPSNVVAFVNHTKGTGIQRCMLGSRYIISSFGVIAFLALVHLVTNKNVGGLGLSLSLPTISLFCIYLFRYLQRFRFQKEFEGYVKKNIPQLSFSEKQKMRDAYLGKSPLQTVTIPTEKNVSVFSSQKRFLNSISGAHKDLFGFSTTDSSPTLSIDSSLYLGKSFEELIGLKDGNLWHLILKGKVRGVAIVVEKAEYTKMNTYHSKVIAKPGIDFSVLERCHIRPTVKEKPGKTDHTRIFKENESYAASWSYEAKEEQSGYSWYSNKERRKRQKRAKA